MNLKTIFQTSVNLLFPASCPVCKNGSVEYPMSVCEACKGSVLSEENLPPISSERISEIRSCSHYEGIVRDCVRQFKYNKNRNLISLFSRIIIKYLCEYPVFQEDADLIIPVPLHWLRIKSRGFNQSELLARILSEYLYSPVSTRNLIKIRNTHPQSGLPRNARMKNLRNSFSVLHPFCITGKSVMLVDDVMTTGATLDSCAAELARAGAKKVSAFTLARTL